ncbi:MAG TPA: hypothetical protein VGW78_06620 [Candidatus Babeliales bacterium]|nr:hypothetical protein [Candidatus Babeliales bacterium]
MLKKQLSIIALAISTCALVQARFGDVFRPYEEREDYSESPEPVGLLHEEYTTKEGETRTHFAPVERTLGGLTGRYSESHSEPKHYGHKKEYKETKEYAPDNNGSYGYSEYED